MTAKKWIKGTIVFSLLGLVCLGFIAFLIDPFLQYRMTKNKYLLNSRFVNAGIIKNYPFDTILIGSSMMQNFNMKIFDQKLNCISIKGTLGGISLTEIQQLLKMAAAQEKCEKVYLCMDLYLLSEKKENDLMRWPDYLYDDNKLNDFRYLLGYESWMRFIPVDIAIDTLFRCGLQLPENFSFATDIDYLEYWNDSFKFGKDVVMKAYLNSAVSPSTPNLSELEKRMKSRFDEFLLLLNEPNLEYTLFFPPYSALYWYTAQKDQYFESYMKIKQHIVSECATKSNITIYDFQNMPLISDLNNYKDSTHYSEEINNLMTDSFAAKKYIVDQDSIDRSISTLEDIVDAFAKDNSDWLIS